jgi:hypothetical protein
MEKKKKIMLEKFLINYIIIIYNKMDLGLMKNFLLLVAVQMV